MNHLHESTQALLRVDGPWLRCRQCEHAFWGAFRDEAFVGPRIRKHVRKAHAAQAQAGRPNPPKGSDPLADVERQLQLRLA